MKAPKNQQEASQRAYKMVHGPGASDHNSKTLIGVKSVAELIDGSPSTVWRRVKDGLLPKPIKFGGMTRWSLAEIEAVIEAKLAERDEPEAA